MIEDVSLANFYILEANNISTEKLPATAQRYYVAIAPVFSSTSFSFMWTPNKRNYLSLISELFKVNTNTA